MTGGEKHSALVLGDSPLTIEDIVSVAREYRPVSVSDGARRRIRLSRAVVDTLLKHDVKVYGITTGFASLRHTRISPEKAGKLSENLIKSHACGVGGPFDEDVVRAAMLLRAQTFSLGYSGVTEKLCDTIVKALNNKIYPFVPEQGSVGSSGDLAPLSHLFLALIGNPYGMIHRRNVETSWQVTSAMRRGGGEYISHARREDFVTLGDLSGETPLAPLSLQAKEGLAATNSAAFATALAALSAFDAGRLIESSELITALSFEALQAVPDALDDKIANSRPYAGHSASARAIRTALDNSDMCPGYVISGFNMAEYNQALIGLTQTLAENRDGADAKSAAALEGLLQQMRERQGKIPGELRQARAERSGQSESLPARDAELVICRMAFASVTESWERLLGWGEGDNSASE
ncbi:MAG: aromatic amino acid lyase, partial [candidate division Zixibacteria bacterium]|nr:aromatic amino acid lyase [candidate division Zixibacteria bacterium]